MTRAVLDTNTLVSAVINIQSSVSQEIFQYFKSEKFVLVISPAVLTELDRVLHEERIMKRYKLTNKKIDITLNELINLSYVVSENIKVEVVRDPDDNKIIEAAIEGKASYIVTRDKDLLDLEKYEGIKMKSPEEFIKVLRADS